MRYEFGPFRLDPGRRLFERGQDTLQVPARTFDLLLTLVEQRHRVVEKDELVRLVWRDTVVEDSNLTQQIFVLRKLLGETPGENRYIATIPRRGYQFVAPVRASDEQPAAGGDAVPGGAREGPLCLALPLAGASLAMGPAGAFAISPDGRWIAYAGRSADGARLFLRRLDSFEPQVVSGACDPIHVFFSPDSEWVGFVAGDRLWKASVRGGAPLALCETDRECRGATWCRDGTIVFAPTPASGLWRLAAGGGPPRPLTHVDFEAGERTHRWPEAIPGTDGVVFTVASAGAGSYDEAQLALVSVRTGERRPLGVRGSHGRYLASGHLAYGRRGMLMVCPFDPVSGALTGGETPAVTQVWTAPTGVVHCSVSGSGTLVLLRGEAVEPTCRLVLADATGHVETLPVVGTPLEEPRVSPDGSALVVGVRGTTSDLWVYDFGRAALARVTFEGDNFAGVWTPDGSRLTFSANVAGPCNIYTMAADGSVPPVPLMSSAYDQVPGSWSPDGAWLAYTEYHPETGADLWLYRASDGDTTPLVRSRFAEYGPVFAHGGRHLAYTSDESGRAEVCVARIGGPPRKWQISSGGGAEPVWSRDTHDLFYREPEGVVAVRVDLDPAGDLRIGPPRLVLADRYARGSMTGLPNYDVLPDGDRLVLVESCGEPQPPGELLVMLNWFETL